MRKVISVFLPLLFAIAMVAFPTDAISAQTASTPQPAPPSPAAMQAGEKESIDDILKELDQARKLTNDRNIQNQIGIIKDWVKKMQGLAERGDTKAALEIKYTIARRLEWLINQLPMATPGTTTAVANIATPNPLYDELVRIRAKIDNLIDIEEREIPTEKPPTPPEIRRPPEMEKLIVYSAKFLCGPAFGGEGVQPGSYSTAINIHNPHNDTIYLFKKAVIAQREDEPRGRISAFHKVRLAPDEAIEVDCIDIVRFFGPQQATLLPAPSQQTATMLQPTAVSPIDAPIRFIKGFVVIYATAPLDVVGVYTASTSAGFSLDVEQIPRSAVGVLPIPIPEEPEEEVCPQGCACMTKDAAYKRYGQNAIQCQQDKPCGYADAAKQIPMFCWKPAKEGKPSLTLKPEYDENKVGDKHKVVATVIDGNGNPVRRAQVSFHFLETGSTPVSPTDENGQAVLEYSSPEERKDTIVASVTVDGYNLEAKATKVWISQPTEQACLTGCACLTKDEAYNRYGQNAIQCQQDKPCGYADAAKQIPMFCWKPAEEAKCPQGCVCTTIEEARKYGYVYCQNQQMQCGTDKYCFQKPTPTEVKPTPGRIIIDPSQDRNAVGTQHTITVIVYDTNDKPMANVRVYISHTGANPFAPIELTTDANGKASYYYIGKNAGTDTIVAKVDNLSAKAIKEWYAVVKPAKIDLSPSSDRNPPGSTHTVTATVWGTDDKPMPGVMVSFTVSGTNSASGSSTTDSSGKATFSYSSKLTGKDTITATAGGLTATATKYWERLQ